MQRTQVVLDSDAGALSEGSQILKAVCEDASEHLDADLVSIWRFENDPERIVCLCAFDSIQEAFSSGQVLYQKDFPTYFATIVEESVVCAPDARSCVITKELTEPYFEPNGIVSLLDFIIHHDYVPVGIICCESRQKRRDWSEEDRQYLLQLATLASFKTRL